MWKQHCNLRMATLERSGWSASQLHQLAVVNLSRRLCAQTPFLLCIIFGSHGKSRRRGFASLPLGGRSLRASQKRAVGLHSALGCQARTSWLVQQGSHVASMHIVHSRFASSRRISPLRLRTSQTCRAVEGKVRQALCWRCTLRASSRRRAGNCTDDRELGKTPR